MADSKEEVSLLPSPTEARRRNRKDRPTARRAILIASILLVSICSTAVGWILHFFISAGAAGRHGEFVTTDAHAARRTMADLVLPEGYPLQQRWVETADGYLLGLYRIPFGRGAGGGTPRNRKPCDDDPKPVVLLQHGLLDSSATWVLNGRHRSLGFILADAGFDVWMSNSRGNTFAKRHASLDVDSREFWDFTYDDMVVHDVPAVLWAVLNQTGVQTLTYVGHSQGTLLGFLRFSADSELAHRVGLAVMLAPVLFITHMTSPFLKFLASMSSSESAYALGWKEFLPRGSQQAAAVFGDLCSKHPDACKNIMMAMSGYNPDNLDATRWDYYMEYTPAGTSAKNLVHWSQGYKMQRPNVCQAFDYGANCKVWLFWDKEKCNPKIYGMDTPMLYDVSRYNVPTAVYWGGKDMLADPTDVLLLQGSLTPGAVVHSKYIDEYEHLDFIWGLDAHERIYPEIVSMIQNHAQL